MPPAGRRRREYDERLLQGPRRPHRLRRTGGESMRPVLLCFNLSPAKKGKLAVVCTRAGIRLTPVPAERFGLTVGQILVGEEGPAPLPEEEAFSGEMAVMCGFTDAAVNALYRGMKAARAPLPALMASLTETNAGWTAGRLYRELSAEREALARGETAHEQ